MDGEETSDYSEAGLSGEGNAGAAGVGGGGYGARRRGRRREQLRSYRNSYRPRDANDASPPRIPYRSVSPSPAAGVERRGQKTDKEKEKEMEMEKAKDQSNKSKNNNKKKTELGKGLRGNLNSLSTPDTHTRASSPDPDRGGGGGERTSRSRQPRKLAEVVSTALEEVVASALEEVRARGCVAGGVEEEGKSCTVGDDAACTASTATCPIWDWTRASGEGGCGVGLYGGFECLSAVTTITPFSSSVGITLFILLLHLIERERNIPYHIDIHRKLVDIGIVSAFSLPASAWSSTMMKICGSGLA